MNTGMRVSWTLNGRGWANCVVEDQQAKVELTASHITNAPEEFLTAVARLVSGETDTRAQFEAEPTAFRWIFSRQGNDVWIRLLELRRGSDHDSKGAEIWSSRLHVESLARAVIRCFDEVAWIYDESGYRGTWGERFPRSELEALRCLWNEHRRREDDT
ncbi:hypothetical protein ABZ461_15175 [Actinacidiphila glaucinigra]|uniref:hypothetical protein n=1 Tax=Actinacidiphila glaucinigra TaxID=235986 RepID=UPI0033D36CA4